MRDTLSSLTQRGRILLACGLAVLAASVYLGDRTLLRVGVLLTLLPLLSTLVMAHSRYRISLERRAFPPVIQAGHPTTVELRVTNEGFTPPGSVLIEENLGYALGSRPRFRLRRLTRGSTQTQTYRVSTDVRGRHQLGPALLRVHDPLGLVEVTRGFRSTSSVVVLPLVVPLNGLPTALTANGGSGTTRSATHGDSDDTTLRTYRRGDDVRRIHWRSSARAGDLMVRQEEQPRRPAATLVLDVRATAHRGTGVASSFEAAVRVTASVLTHLLTNGQDVALLLGTTRIDLRAGDSAALGQALESLAVLTPRPEPSLPTHLLVGHDMPRTVIAVLGSLDGRERSALAALAPRGVHGSAFMIDVEAWNPHRKDAVVVPTGPTAWQCVPLGPRSSLTEAWRSVIA